MYQTEELKDEIRRDMLEEARMEAAEESAMRSSVETAIELLGISDDSTIEELFGAVAVLYGYGWDVTACDILEEIA
jgi:hypothetical protein